MPEGSTTSALVTDPVCGMSVDPARARARADHEGRTYYFCCPGCAQKFSADPQKYLSKPSGLVNLSPPTPSPKAVGGLVTLGAGTAAKGSPDRQPST
ncbi:MAG: YHS domain-containing protein, partial [Terriglobales bacterium]